jgi:serine/threonine protein kinase
MEQHARPFNASPAAVVFLHHLSESGLQLRAEERHRQRLPSTINDDAMSPACRPRSLSGMLTAFQLDAINRGKPNELKIGNYDVLDRLGAGGMGTVVKARHRRMKRIVALKILSSSLSKDHSFVQRFQREVETIARLQHPNIVMAFDADEAEIGHFLVMEFVDGRDLSSVVEKTGPLSIALANYTLQKARGLAYAHSQEIIHRDIKPANLLLDASGVVKVTDLGLATHQSGGGGGSSATGITQAGGIVGTVDYMSPEQAVDSTDVDHRCDIYSLGCTLYFLLTGRSIYGGGNAMSILVRHREAPIPWLLSVREDVPPELENIFRRMVAKKPDDRFSKMSEVVTELESLAARLPRTADSVTTPLFSNAIGFFDRSESARSEMIVTPPATDTGHRVDVEPSRMRPESRGYLEPSRSPSPELWRLSGSDGAIREKNPPWSFASSDDMTESNSLAKFATRSNKRPDSY